jgi:hypothetical protein
VDNIDSFSKKFCADEGMIYVSVVFVYTEGLQPVISAIDSVTATAAKGTAFTCSSMGVGGKLLIPAQ